MHKNFIKKIALMLVLVFSFSILAPANAMEERTFTINDEIMTYQIFYDSIECMKRGKAKHAFKAFMKTKFNHTKVMMKDQIAAMTEKQFNAYLKEAQLPMSMTKESLALEIDKQFNKLSQRFENNIGSMSNKEVQITVKTMVKEIQKTQKRSFVVGALVGGGIVAVAAVVGAGIIVKKFLKGFWNMF